MTTRDKRTSSVPADEILDEIGAFLVGGGLITMVLFPLALPIILLVTIPLIPIVLVTAVAGAILAAPVLLFRRLRRGRRRPASRGRPSTPAALRRPPASAISPPDPHPV